MASENDMKMLGLGGSSGLPDCTGVGGVVGLVRRVGGRRVGMKCIVCARGVGYAWFPANIHGLRGRRRSIDSSKCMVA